MKELSFGNLLSFIFQFLKYNDFFFFYLFSLYRKKQPWSEDEFIDEWNSLSISEKLEKPTRPAVAAVEAAPLLPFIKGEGDPTSPFYEREDDEEDEEDGDESNYQGTGYPVDILEAFIRDQCDVPSEEDALERARELLPSEEELLLKAGRSVSTSDAIAFMRAHPEVPQIAVLAKREVLRNRMINESKDRAFRELHSIWMDDLRPRIFSDLRAHLVRTGKPMVLEWKDEANKPVAEGPEPKRTRVSFFFFFFIYLIQLCPFCC